ncbi:hypothetical protein HDU96_001871 [Phlyctochytrium bullatum]|nr:hypothetical protein HDU96_001871 [Phlyctochytrium bullatum]
MGSIPEESYDLDDSLGHCQVPSLASSRLPLNSGEDDDDHLTVSASTDHNANSSVVSHQASQLNVGVPTVGTSDVDILKMEMAELRAAHETDAALLSIKDREIADLRERLADVRALLSSKLEKSTDTLVLREDESATDEAKNSKSTAACGSGSPSSTASVASVGKSEDLDIIMTCLKRLQMDDFDLLLVGDDAGKPSSSSRLNRRGMIPSFPSLMIDTSSHTLNLSYSSSSLVDPNGSSNENLPDDSENNIGGSSGSGGSLPGRRRGSLLSSNSSASSVATVVVSPTSALTGAVGTSTLTGVKSIWGPPLDVSSQSQQQVYQSGQVQGGLYGQEILTQEAQANSTAPAAENSSSPTPANSASVSLESSGAAVTGQAAANPTSQMSLTQFKRLWKVPSSSSSASASSNASSVGDGDASLSAQSLQQQGFQQQQQYHLTSSLQNADMHQRQMTGQGQEHLVGLSAQSGQGSISQEFNGYEAQQELYAGLHGMNVQMHPDNTYGQGSVSPSRIATAVNTSGQEGGDWNSTASFRYLVDKIVKTNDQPSSLLLQQRLKVATTETRNLIFEAIRSQALPLIRNRFGNFLMQRCLEYGTPSQVRVLAGAMVGHVYALSCDRFGCHVVQKALDVCDDTVKLQIISELLRAIPETITHRFACHVWQRVFETRWQGGCNHRPRVCQRVDSALKGQWHLVANDENGSLVVQCIFENCGDEEKRGIVAEVLANTIDIARGQWGNWVIQHLLEHGSPSDKQHILKVVARHVYAMSIDQFASKVVEKGLKTCQRRDLYDIVDMVLSPSLRESGPGILDMMNNQYANYVVQHILTLSDPNQRDACARLIAPHLPVLRGSKYGQRVAALVEKHIRTSHQRFGTILSVAAAQHAAAQQHHNVSAAAAAAVAAAAVVSAGGIGHPQSNVAVSSNGPSSRLQANSPSGVPGMPQQPSMHHGGYGMGSSAKVSTTSSSSSPIHSLSVPQPVQSQQSMGPPAGLMMGCPPQQQTGMVPSAGPTSMNVLGLWPSLGQHPHHHFAQLGAAPLFATGAGPQGN